MTSGATQGPTAMLFLLVPPGTCLSGLQCMLHRCTMHSIAGRSSVACPLLRAMVPIFGDSAGVEIFGFPHARDHQA